MGDFFCQFDIQVTHFLLRRVYSLITGESWGKHYLPPARTRLASCHNTDEDACTTWVFAGDTRSCTQTVHAHTRSFVCASLGARIHEKKALYQHIFLYRAENSKAQPTVLLRCAVMFHTFVCLAFHYVSCTNSFERCVNYLKLQSLNISVHQLSNKEYRKYLNELIFWFCYTLGK